MGILVASCVGKNVSGIGAECSGKAEERAEGGNLPLRVRGEKSGGIVPVSLTESTPRSTGMACSMKKQVKNHSLLLNAVIKFVGKTP